MARVIDGGSAAFNAIALPEVNHKVQDYLFESMDSLRRTMGDTVSRVERRARELYDSFRSMETEITKRRARSMSTTHRSPTSIMELRDIAELRSAPPLMQRYVMANPKIRSLHISDRCDGYTDTYVKVDKVGVDDYDYRRVTNGVFVEEGDRLICRAYIEDLDPEDRELTSLEQKDIMNTWETMDIIIDCGDDDFTNPVSSRF